MFTHKEVAKVIEEKICAVHHEHPCLGNLSNVIPVLTCCRKFKTQLLSELIKQYGEEFVQKTIRLT